MRCTRGRPRWHSGVGPPSLLGSWRATPRWAPRRRDRAPCWDRPWGAPPWAAHSPLWAAPLALRGHAGGPARVPRRPKLGVAVSSPLGLEPASLMEFRAWTGCGPLPQIGGRSLLGGGGPHLRQGSTPVSRPAEGPPAHFGRGRFRGGTVRVLLHSLELRTGPPEEPCVLLHKGSFEDPAWQVLRERFLKAGEAQCARVLRSRFALMPHGCTNCA